MNQDQYVNHEVRIQILERIADSIDKRFDKIEATMHSNFLWLLGSFFGVMVTILATFGGVVLHVAKLT